jgi:hypothetical protein
MMKIPMLLILSLLASLAAPAAMSQQTETPMILGPGVYLKDELPENARGVWLGLIQEQEDVWKLEQVSVETRPVFLEGDKPDAPGGVRVFASENKRAMLFMRGLSLPASNTQVAKAWYQPAKTPGEQVITGTLGKGAFKVQGEATPGSDKVTVLFSWENRAQALCTLSDDEDSSWDILWAGDLDGDDVPDFIFAIAEHDKGTQQLLLSGRARPGQIVGLVASHRYTFSD